MPSDGNPLTMTKVAALPQTNFKPVWEASASKPPTGSTPTRSGRFPSAGILTVTPAGAAWNERRWLPDSDAGGDRASLSRWAPVEALRDFE
jgi:hypothetical protein